MSTELKAIQLEKIIDSFQFPNSETNEKKTIEINSKNKEIGTKALVLIDQILEENSNSIFALTERLKINNWVFENTSAIIADAEYIIQNESFESEKMIGYNWLFWIYSEKLAIKDKAKEILEDQILACYSIFKKRYELDENLGYLLDKLAHFENEQGNEDKALSLWIQSFEKYPYIHNRNGQAGLLCLKNGLFNEASMLLNTYNKWSENSGNDYIDAISEQLNLLYNQNKIDAFEDLIGLKFNLEVDGNKNDEKISYYKTFIAENEKTITELLKKFPKNYLLNITLAIAYNKVNNSAKTHEYRKAAAACGSLFYYPNVEYLYHHCLKLKQDFFEIEFSENYEANELYNLMTATYDLYLETKDKRFAKLAEKFGAKCYKLYSDYFYRGEGNGYRNQPHLFAMACNNYGLCIFGASKDDDNEVKLEACAIAAKIHWEGYQMSPFSENIGNAVISAYRAKLYDVCLKYIQTNIEDYGESLSNLDKQDLYWYRMYCQLKLELLQEAQSTYYAARNLYIEHTSGDIEATEKFILSAENYFYYEISTDCNELKWFFNETVFEKLNPISYAFVTFILAELLVLQNQTEEAKFYLEQGITLFSIHKEDAENFNLKKFKKAKLLYAQITGNRESLKIEPSFLFEIDYVEKKEYLLHSSQNYQNCLRIKDFVTTLNAAYEPFDFRINNDIYIRLSKSEDDADHSNLYDFYISNMFTKEDFYFAASEMFSDDLLGYVEYHLTAYTDKDNDETKKFKLIHDSSTNFNEQQLEGLKWWNEICNRFYTLFPDRDF